MLVLLKRNRNISNSAKHCQNPELKINYIKFCFFNLTRIHINSGLLVWIQIRNAICSHEQMSDFRIYTNTDYYSPKKKQKKQQYYNIQKCYYQDAFRYIFVSWHHKWFENERFESETKQKKNMRKDHKKKENIEICECILKWLGLDIQEYHQNGIRNFQTQIISKNWVRQEIVAQWLKLKWDGASVLIKSCYKTVSK